MPKSSPSIFDELDADVVSAVEERLARWNGSDWRRLDARDMAKYQGRLFEGGWRLRIFFSDGPKHLDVLVARGFPFISARTALLEHPPKLTWPHVEEDGVLCLFGNGLELDESDPATVVENLLARSCRLVEELIEGKIIDRDFREEFLTYWAYDLYRPRRHYSLLRPDGNSREIRAWNSQALTVVAENDDDLKSWLQKFVGVERPFTTVPAALLLFEKAPLPAEYPQRARHVLDLARLARGNGIGILGSIVSDSSHPLTVVISAPGRAGPGLVVSTIDVGMAGGQHADRRASAGFRKNNTPKDILIGRIFGAQKVARSLVTRADANWIHGRGRDPRSERLLESKVVLFGCGSVGSFVAATLLKAGVGTLHVVDPDKLEWPNVGRHYLGGESVGLNKASEFAKRSQAEFPHLNVFGHDTYAESVLREAPDWLSDADLIISTTGSGRADKALNEWQKLAARSLPIVYGWTEPFAGAGHAVAITGSGGCLSAGVNNLGLATFEMTLWKQSAMMEEPACGVHFAPYGPIELSRVNDLVVELSIDCLLGKLPSSTHRVWAARQAHLDEFDGAWTVDGRKLLGANTGGGCVINRPWPRCSCC